MVSVVGWIGTHMEGYMCKWCGGFSGNVELVDGRKGRRM